MACRIQQKHPIQLNFTFPENGCRNDITIYHHPDVGQQRSVFGCDWDEREQIYDCDKLEPGVTWNRPDSEHAVITLPEHFEQDSGYFRYQISCHGQRQNDTCSWAPVDHTTRVEALTSTTAMRTEYTVQQSFSQAGSQDIYGLVAGGFAANIVTSILVFILVLAFAISIILLYKKIKFTYKGFTKEIESKLQQIEVNTENKRKVESEDEVISSSGSSWKQESDTKSLAYLEVILPTPPESSDTEAGSDAENQSLESNPLCPSADRMPTRSSPMFLRYNIRKPLLMDEENKSRTESEIESESHYENTSSDNESETSMEQPHRREKKSTKKVQNK